jgi:predicted dehydrogenase/aryl-alcohol dehydrogenase-like predicted oxidoreductase
MTEIQRPPMDSTSLPNLRWGILGVGSIAKKFATSLPRSATGRLVALGSRDLAKAEAAATAFGGARAHGSYEALLADPEVDAVYIATPHPLHAHWAIRAAEAGKHILCEKPLCLNHAEAMAVVEAARAHDVFLMEAFMYRCHPQTAALVAAVRRGAIGELKAIDAAFSFRTAFNPASRLLSPALGGGGILDVGCYPMSMARLLAGAALNQPFAEPVDLRGVGLVGPVSGVDEHAAATLRFSNGMIAQLSCGVQLARENAVVLYGTEGSIRVSTPWIPQEEWSFVIRHPGAAEEIVSGHADRPLYALEADCVAANLDQRQAPQMSWDDTLGNLRGLDQWRRQIGLVYPSEQPNAHPARLVHAKTRAGSPPIPQRPLAGLAGPVSVLTMGVDNQFAVPHAAVMFDDFIERGGNCFDTAFIYGGGVCEKVFGQWLRTRGGRKEIRIIAKGAHTPFCEPKWIRRQLEISLERMGVDRADIYLMHRDNPDVPVGEFIDALNQLKTEGLISVFGGSNWSLARVAEANAYAAARGQTGFGAVSNQFSLARMVDPVWSGCISASDPASRQWLVEQKMPNFAWSSQARGFFTARSGPEKRDDAELVRCWYADDNFERKRRAEALAGARGVLAINIALAYVLAQPFPSFTLIGPRGLDETRASLEALRVKLSPEELAWLNLESEEVPPGI